MYGLFNGGKVIFVCFMVQDTLHLHGLFLKGSPQIQLSGICNTSAERTSLYVAHSTLSCKPCNIQAIQLSSKIHSLL